jgi:hypothetical protein
MSAYHKFKNAVGAIAEEIVMILVPIMVILATLFLFLVVASVFWRVLTQ